MYLLNYLSLSTVYFLLYGSVILLIGGAILSYLPTVFSKFAVPVIFISALVISLCTYTIGSSTEAEKSANTIKEIQHKISEIVVKSETIKEIVKIKYVDRIKVITEKGEEIIQYVDREVQVDNSECNIGDDVIDVLNDAATNNGEQF